MALIRTRLYASKQNQPPWRIRASLAADKARILPRRLNCKAKGGSWNYFPSTLRFPPKINTRRSTADCTQQEIARTAERVVRVRGLSHWRTRIEVVILVARSDPQPQHGHPQPGGTDRCHNKRVRNVGIGSSVHLDRSGTYTAGYLGNPVWVLVTIAAPIRPEQQGEQS